MQLSLTECGRMEYREASPKPRPSAEGVTLAVSCCAVCRTDAKMWRQGHRDLVLPRVLGHEIAGVDDSGQLYAVWPGQVCGRCRYCLGRRENLCEQMRIIGFHSDGGFARYITVPRESLIPVDQPIDHKFLTFAEPVACVLNGISQLGLQAKEKAVVVGGGVLGILAALVLRERNLVVTVIEKSQQKIAKLTRLCEGNAIELCKDTVRSDFDIAINCCDNPVAFSLCITKLRKGGRLAFFSGLKKNEELDVNLLNLIHYRELEVYGSYGPRKEHMADAVPFCVRQQENLGFLVEKVIDLPEVEGVLPKILSGNELKYVVDFASPADRLQRSTGDDPVKTATARKEPGGVTPFLKQITSTIAPCSPEMQNRAQQKVDAKAKPLGALGKIEDLAVRVSVIKETLSPAVPCKRMFVFAGDHGVVEEGISAFPSRVTVQMVENFLHDGAAINAFCKHYDIELAVVDMGVKGEFADHPRLIKNKVGPGTRNFATRSAMSREQAIAAIENGARSFFDRNRRVPCDLVGMGEMGIGNTSSATAIICAASGLPVAEVAGRGTGVDDRGLLHKRQVIEKALALHRPRKNDALDLLAKVGGYEIGGICGAVLAAASQRCCVVLDGLISTAAGLLAYLLCPEVRHYLIAGHRSVEVGQLAALEIMGLEPVLDLNLRLGEGTGAAITMNMVDLACTMMRDMASFEEAGVSRKGREGG
ncbi:MAG: nicotinate-nucleotide--dimethylbenzimidazole phosphoribosyltransferase [Desulforhopalus sp.]